MSKEHIIYKITPGSIAEEMEIEAGDVLVSINGKEIEDVFDFHYAVNDEYLEILIRKADGEERLCYGRRRRSALYHDP